MLPALSNPRRFFILTSTFLSPSQLAVPEPDWNEASADIVATGTVAEAAVLSTCNRFEVYYAAADAHEAMKGVTKYLSKRSGLRWVMLSF